MVSAKKKKKYWAYYTEKPQDRPIPDTIKRSPGKKDTKTWCRGKVGQPHYTEIVRDKNLAYLNKGCHLDDAQYWERLMALPYYRKRAAKGHFWRRWRCYHVEECINCKKVIRHSINADECPEYRGEK